mmetsp:Transcript_44362/g.105038  ORF Transcript_44362/g.105038 Transcript_44362/m.105038 type:complete len:1030 (-) Transcript_44362:194-3283(-)
MPGGEINGSKLAQGALAGLHLSDDKEEAATQYRSLRQQARKAFESFLRSLNARSLRFLEHEFEKGNMNLTSDAFCKIFTKVFPPPPPEDIASTEERNFVVHLAALTLFEDIDVDKSGEASWMEFVEYVIAVAEELRMQDEEGATTKFDFYPSQTKLDYVPKKTKKTFDKLFYWPEHPLETIMVFEEGQKRFHLHRHPTMQRRRSADGHRDELLAGAYVSDPAFELVVTAGNDKLVCFWDNAFNLIKKWNMECTIGCLCWCPEISALYFAEHFSETVQDTGLQAWRLSTPIAIREATEPPKPDRSLTFSTGHTRAIQSMLWIGKQRCLASASLDTTVKLFDLVQCQRTHTLTGGHTKGLTCMEYCDSLQYLLTAGYDNYISLWDPGSATLRHKLHGHKCSIAGMCIMPDAEYEIMSVDVHSVVKLWDIRRLACLQSFHASDPQAEKDKEIEPLEPKDICPLGRNRVLVSGRRMVMFDRDASDPHLTADSLVTSMEFNQRKLEIVTSVKNHLSIWDALTGDLLKVHKNVTEANITAMSLGLADRRLFVGTEAGNIVVLNYACAAMLKSLEPHSLEVTQIVVMPSGRVLTLSTADRLINIHDDGEEKRAVVLKRIDLSHMAAAVVHIAHDGSNVIVATTEEGDAFWYNIDSAKQVSSTTKSECRHEQAVTCAKFFNSAPLMVTGDLECHIIFWLLLPLRPYDFFSSAEVFLVSEEPQGNPGSPRHHYGTFGITCLTMSPDETFLFLGTENGTVACVHIAHVRDAALRLRAEVLQRKEVEDMDSGHMPASLSTLPNVWVAERAHRASIESVIRCEGACAPVVLSLGLDWCVRLWSHETGEALGTLEQGLPGRSSYERTSPWCWPVNAHEMAAQDNEKLTDAMELQFDASDDEDDDAAAAAAVAEVAKKVTMTKPRTSLQSPELPALPDRGPGRISALNMSQLMHSESAPQLRKGSPTKPKFPKKAAAPPLRTGPRTNMARRGPTTDEWLAGPLAPGYIDMLPHLESGLQRKVAKQNNEIIRAAQSLSNALNKI